MANRFRPNVERTRSYPTLRSLLRGGRNSAGRAFRAPWYSDFPNRSHSSWANSLKRRG
jgi:hypothetical protein